MAYSDFNDPTFLPPIYPGQLQEEDGTPYDLSKNSGGASFSGLEKGAQTFGSGGYDPGDYPGGVGDPGPPPPETTPPPETPPRTSPPPKKQPVPVDPATGEKGGQPTGPAPAKQTDAGPYKSIDDVLAEILAGQNADRAEQARRRQQLQQTLDESIQSAKRPISRSDPEIFAPTNAFNAQGQRARALLQEELAQEAAATGKTTGSVSSAVQNSFENLGNATGSYEGSLITGELQNRRSQLQSSLAIAAQIGDAATTSRIQEEIAALNAKIATQAQKNDLGKTTNSLDDLLAEWIKSQNAA